MKIAVQRGMKKNRRVALLLFVGTIVARVAAADPISITSGSLVMNPFSGPLTLAGDRGFTFNSSVSVFGSQPLGFFEPWEVCANLHAPEPCTPGSVLGLNAIWFGTEVIGPATLDGVSYPDVGSPTSPSTMAVQFLGTVVLPPLASSATLTAPFTFTGTFFHPGDSGFTNDALLGGGTATLYFSGSESSGLWRLNAARYDLAGSPSPTPEPSTLLLLGGASLALAGVVAGRSRRSAHMSPPHVGRASVACSADRAG
jgi:hypothetical protein